MDRVVLDGAEFSVDADANFAGCQDVFNIVNGTGAVPGRAGVPMRHVGPSERDDALARNATIIERGLSPDVQTQTTVRVSSRH